MAKFKARRVQINIVYDEGAPSWRVSAWDGSGREVDGRALSQTCNERDLLRQTLERLGLKFCSDEALMITTRRGSKQITDIS